MGTFEVEQTATLFFQAEETAAAEDPQPRRQRSVHVEGPGTDESREMSVQLLQAYHRAFIAQYIGTKKIELLLQHDAAVGPFIERVLELANSGQHGSPEFPGFLETLAAHFAQTEADSKPDHVREALMRVSRQLYTPAHFITRLVVEGSAEVPADRPPEFLVSVAAVQAVASMLTVDESSGLSKAMIAERVTASFTDMPEVWQNVYGRAADASALNTWKALKALLKPYEYQGRLSSNIREKPEDEQRKPRRTQGRSGNPARRQEQAEAAEQRKAAQKARDVENITGEAQPAEQISSFGILKGTGSSAGARYSLEALDGGLDELMQSQIVAKFLRGNQGLKADLRAFLKQIADDPYHNPGVGVVHQERKFRLDGPGTLNQPYSVRRFSPRQSAGEGGLTHPLSNRVRIFFGICIVKGQKYLAIRDIELRESNTY